MKDRCGVGEKQREKMQVVGKSSGSWAGGKYTGLHYNIMSHYLQMSHVYFMSQLVLILKGKVMKGAVRDSPRPTVALPVLIG